MIIKYMENYQIKVKNYYLQLVSIFNVNAVIVIIGFNLVCFSLICCDKILFQLDYKKIIKDFILKDITKEKDVIYAQIVVKIIIVFVVLIIHYI